MKPSIAILGEYTPTFQPHVATNHAIAHSCSHLTSEVKVNWVPTEAIDPTLFDTHAGIWVAPGSPYKNMQKVLWAIQYAREHNVPCLGTCGGFQHMIIEYARNALGFKDAQSQENDPYASDLVVSKLACSLAGRKMRLTFTDGSQIAKIYDCLTATEEYYCNFGVNPEYISYLKSHSLQITGADSEGEFRVITTGTSLFYRNFVCAPDPFDRRQSSSNCHRFFEGCSCICSSSDSS